MSKRLPGTVDRSDLAGGVRVSDQRRVIPTMIVIHRNTAHEAYRRAHPDFQGSDLEALAAFHQQPGPWHFRLFPYHLFVDRDGVVYQVHNLMTVSPHASGANQAGIGVAFNCDGRIESPGPAQWAGAVKAIRTILQVFPRCGIIPHSPAKRCPGPKIRVASLAKEVVSG